MFVVLTSFIPSQSARSRALASAVDNPTTLTFIDVCEEMKFVRAEALSAIAAREKMTATRNLDRYDELTRRLQVGHYLRNGSLSDFQRSKCRVLLSRLERCKDLTEAGEFQTAREMSHPIFLAHIRCRAAFTE